MLNNHLRKISTQTRLVVLSFLLIVGGGILAYGLSVRVVKERWVEARKIDGLASAQDEAREIGEWIDWEFDQLNTTSNYISMLREKGSTMRAAVAGLHTFSRGRSAPADFIFLSPSGRVVYSALGLVCERAALERLQGIARTWDSEFKNIGRKEERALVSHGSGLLLAVPTFSRGGEYLGSFVVYISSTESPFGESIRSFEASQGKEMILAGLNGDTLSRIGVKMSSLGRETLTRLMTREPATGAMLNDNDVYSFAKVPSAPWYVFVRQSTAGLNSEISRIREAILLIGIGSMLLLLLFSVWMVGTLTAPMRALVRATGTVALDRFQPISLKLGGEAGELIMAFNKIGDSLNRSYKRLSTLNSFGSAIVSDIREHNVGERVVRAVVSSMNVDACILLLPDEAGNLRPDFSVGFRDECIAGAASWKDVPHIAKILDGKKPLVENNLDFKDGVGCDSTKYRFLRKFIGVPILMSGKTHGVLAAANGDGGPDFAELDVELLGAFASHAAVAIQNSAYFRQKEEDLQNIRRLKDELIQSEKMSAIGQLVSGVAHELNNPMGVVMGYAELLEQAAPEGRIASYAKRIREAAGRASAIVKNLLTFSRKQPHRRERVDLNGVIRSVIDILSHPLKLSKIEVSVKLQPGPSDVRGDVQELQQVFLNLVTNSMQAMEGMEGARLEIHTYSDGKRVTAVVSDNGQGIPSGMHSKIFEPFYTTKPVGKGTGLGLSICYGIITDLGGAMRVESEAGNGASFVIDLPALPEEGKKETKSESEPTLYVEGLRVLVVDDDHDVREMLVSVLGNAGCDVTSAKDAETALAALSDIRVDAIVSDMRMPGMDGREFFSTCLEQYSEYKGRFVFISGDPSGDGINEFLDRAGAILLHKPFTTRELTASLKYVTEDGGQESSSSYSSIQLNS